MLHSINGSLEVVLIKIGVVSLQVKCSPRAQALGQAHTHNLVRHGRDRLPAIVNLIGGAHLAMQNALRDGNHFFSGRKGGVRLL